jgi:hypothetical protein
MGDPLPSCSERVSAVSLALVFLHLLNKRRHEEDPTTTIAIEAYADNMYSICNNNNSESESS